MNGPGPHVAVLAAGGGRRMKSDSPKALIPVFYQPMLLRALDAVRALPRRSLTIVAGRGEKEVRELLRTEAGAAVVTQDAPLGTADAVRALEPALNAAEGDLLILNADNVLLTSEALGALLEAHAASGAAATRAAAAGSDPDSAAAYVFRLKGLFALLRGLAPAGPRREFRLSDAFRALADAGEKTALHSLDPELALSVDDFEALARVETLLRARRNAELMLAGVRLSDPSTTTVDPRSRVARGATIEGGATIVNSVLEEGVRVESACRIADSEIGRDSVLLQGTRVEKSRVGRDCSVGPYGHLRPGTSLSEGVRVGNFVEIKNSTVGAGTKISHLSYIGDAQVGRNVNVGCGFVTCNYDGGPVKQRTVIEDGVFIGSDSQAIAPVTLGAGSFVATGTSVTEDVPPDSFVISRGRQVTKPGYAKKYGRSKPRTPSPRLTS